MSHARRLASGPAAGEAALAEIERQWNAAARTWDVDALAAIYADDALMYGGRPGLFVGPQIRDYFASYIGVLKETTLDLVDQHIIALAPDVFLAQGFGEFHFLLGDGNRSGSVLRTTLVIVRRDGRWRIIQHHFSATPAAPPI